jgi:hypothetical protein
MEVTASNRSGFHKIRRLFLVKSEQNSARIRLARAKSRVSNQVMRKAGAQKSGLTFEVKRQPWRREDVTPYAGRGKIL